MKNLTTYIKDAAPVFITTVIAVIAAVQINNRFIEPRLAKKAFTAPPTNDDVAANEDE